MYLQTAEVVEHDASNLQLYEPGLITYLEVNTTIWAPRSKEPVPDGLCGSLTRDGLDHFLFEESLTMPVVQKRNEQVFCGRHITFTKSDAGELRPNFRRIDVAAPGFDINSFVLSVSDELREGYEKCLLKK